MYRDFSVCVPEKLTMLFSAAVFIPPFGKHLKQSERRLNVFVTERFKCFVQSTFDLVGPHECDALPVVSFKKRTE